MTKKILLITGGSRGIGAATARLAARQGYDLALVYRSDEAAVAAVARDCISSGARVETIRADLASEDDILAAFHIIDEKFGPLTHLVNNAGITGPSSRFADVTAETIRETIDTNVTGAILVAREAVRRMSRRLGGKGGVIINISSAAATLGSPGEYVWYAASKGAIDSLTIGMSKELAEDGIRVAAVAPGLTDTEIHVKSSRDGARVERLTPSIPMGRIGRPEEIADAICYMLSDQATYIAGATLRVAGGR
ncbi:SDR family oxidoreductase [soil metagenome]